MRAYSRPIPGKPQRTWPKEVHYTRPPAGGQYQHLAACAGPPFQSGGADAPSPAPCCRYCDMELQDQGQRAVICNSEWSGRIFAQEAEGPRSCGWCAGRGSSAGSTQQPCRRCQGRTACWQSPATQCCQPAASSYEAVSASRWWAVCGRHSGWGGWLCRQASRRNAAAEAATASAAPKAATTAAAAAGWTRSSCRGLCASRWTAQAAIARAAR